jgi:hypothetical protein
MDAGQADARPLQRHPLQYGPHAPFSRRGAPMLSFYLGLLFG